MNIYDVYPRTWLRSTDLEPGKAYRTRIAGVDLRPGPRGQRVVLLLNPPVRGFSEAFLNSSSAWALASAWGPETDDWTGEIIIFRKRFGGKEGIAIAPAPLKK